MVWFDSKAPKMRQVSVVIINCITGDEVTMALQSSHKCHELNITFSPRGSMLV
jgi:hypothetical protein